VYLNQTVMFTQNSGRKVDLRSVHEATNVGAALDALLAEGSVTHRSEGVEILATRFIGLIQVVKTNDWTFMEGVQRKVVGVDALPLSTRQMTRIVKHGATIAALSSRAAAVSANSNARTARGSNGRGEQTGPSAAQATGPTNFPHREKGYSGGSGAAAAGKGAGAAASSRDGGSKAP
jgi:hypothetical protein